MSRWSRFVRAIRNSIDCAWQDRSGQYQDWRESVFRMDHLESRTMLAAFPGGELVTINVANTAVFEGSDPAKPNSAVFTVTLSGPLLVPVSVAYATADGSAQAGLDYTATSGTLTFQPGEISKTISVPITPNISPQPDRAFFMRLLSSGVAATIGNQLGHCTIVDDDGNTIVTVTATTAAASESGPTAGVFQLSRTGPTTKALRVPFALKGTAQNGVDYVKVGGFAVIPAGQATANVNITPIQDTLKEPTEDVVLTLKASKLYEVTQIDNFATVTITDADTAAPAAKLTAAPLKAAAPVYKFTVRYTDDRAINSSTIATGSIRVTGPKSFSQDAKLAKKRISKNKRLIVATYTITGPAGGWVKADNGTYTVSLVANKVKDATGNAAAAASLGTFVVQIP